MTEIAIVTGGVMLAATGGAVACLAIIDQSITSIALALIAAAVVIIPLWFKFRTDQMAARLKEHDVQIAEVVKTSDGMKDALVAVTAKASYAEGALAGSVSAENKANAAAAAKATGAADAASQAHKE